MNENGFIKLHRALMGWEWYKDQYVKGLFIHLLLIANYKDGNFKGKVIKRGQVVTSISNIARDVGMSEMTVQKNLKKLKKSHEIQTKATNKYTIITVVNYEQYQGLLDSCMLPDSTQGSIQSSTQGSINTKNKKNSKNSSSYSDSDSKSHQPKKGKKDDGNENGGNMNIWTD